MFILEFFIKETAFLYSRIDKEIYLDVSDKPLRALMNLQPGEVLKLNKAIYGLVQSPYLWSKKFRSSLERLGFKTLNEDPCCFVKNVGSKKIILLLYVDDIICASTDENMFLNLLDELKKEYRLTHSPLQFVLGAKITQNLEKGTITLSQEAYIDRILDKFSEHLAGIDFQDVPVKGNVKFKDGDIRKGFVDILDCPSDTREKGHMANLPYRSLIGSLLFLSIYTRPDIVHPVSQLAQVMSNPSRFHWHLLLCLTKYVHRTKGISLTYTKNPRVPVSKILTAFVDANYAQHKHRRSVAGWSLMMSGGSVRTASKLIKTVAASTMAAEVHALYHCSNDVKWARSLLKSLGFPQDTTVVYEDNKSVIQFSKNHGMTERNKTIETKYFSVRQDRHKGAILPIHISTKFQIADMHTKYLPKPQFVTLRNKLLGQKPYAVLALYTIPE